MSIPECFPPVYQSFGKKVYYWKEVYWNHKWWSMGMNSVVPKHPKKRLQIILLELWDGEKQLGWSILAKFSSPPWSSHLSFICFLIWMTSTAFDHLLRIWPIPQLCPCCTSWHNVFERGSVRAGGNNELKRNQSACKCWERISMEPVILIW